MNVWMRGKVINLTARYSSFGGYVTLISMTEEVFGEDRSLVRSRGNEGNDYMYV